MIALRWEFVDLFEPWAAPQASLLGAPIASGTIERDDQAGGDAMFAASDVIVAPPAAEGGRHVILMLEVFGSRSWHVMLSTGSVPPQAGDGYPHAIDPVPHIVVPPSGMQGTGRSRDVRAVRPGTLFIAQPSRT